MRFVADFRADRKISGRTGEIVALERKSGAKLCMHFLQLGDAVFHAFVTMLLAASNSLRLPFCCCFLCLLRVLRLAGIRLGRRIWSTKARAL